MLAMLSGENAMTYALTPQHAKRFSQWLAYQIEQYEKKHQKIDAEWIPGTKSPLQSTDFPTTENKDNQK